MNNNKTKSCSDLSTIVSFYGNGSNRTAAAYIPDTKNISRSCGLTKPCSMHRVMPERSVCSSWLNTLSHSDLSLFCSSEFS